MTPTDDLEERLGPEHRPCCEVAADHDGPDPIRCLICKEDWPCPTSEDAARTHAYLTEDLPQW